MDLREDDLAVRAQNIASLAATLMAGWLSNPTFQGGLADAPLREIVELAEKIQSRAEQRVRPR